MPLKYCWYHRWDLHHCDLLLILGTSLSVEPIASMVNEVRDSTPRLLINREAVGPFRFCKMSCCYRDIIYQGECDDGLRELSRLLGWDEEVDSILLSVQNNLSIAL